MLLAAIMGFIFPAAGVGLLFGLAAIVCLNLDFFHFLARRRGTAFAIAALPLQLLYYSCCGFSVLLAELYWQLRDRGIDSARPASQERADRGAGSIPAPAGARRARRLPRWRVRSR
jgi:hypothetical protein